MSRLKEKISDFIVKKLIIIFLGIFIISLFVTRNFLASMGVAFFSLFVLGSVALDGSTNSRSANGAGTGLPFYDEHFAVLMVAIMRADANVDPRQMAYVKNRVEREYFKSDAKRIIQRIEFYNQQKYINLNKVYEEIAENYYTETKVQLLHIIVSLAVIDGLLTAGENQMLMDYCRKVGLPTQILDRLLSLFKFKYEYEQYQQKKSTYTSVSQLQNAFKVLEISENATADEIKKAYKKLAKMYHPDKMLHESEVNQQIALEKFKIIVNAYDLICKKKGIV